MEPTEDVTIAVTRTEISSIRQWLYPTAHVHRAKHLAIERQACFVLAQLVKAWAELPKDDSKA